MDKLRITRIFSRFLLVPMLGAIGLSACNPITAPDTSTAAVSNSAQFASGTKGVKIITSDAAVSGSFGVPGAVPTPTIIPSTFPGADGVATYLPGVSPTQYFSLDGTTTTARPGWFLDFQLGITHLSTATSTCATFGGQSGNSLDTLNFYRTSE